MGKINLIEELTLDGLKAKQYKFRIPLYQRKYAWTSDEVLTLLDDLKTFVSKYNDVEEKYFIGNIVVEQKQDGLFDIIDGQQRFTTLYLIAKIAKKHFYDLHYEIREEDDIFMQNFTYDENCDIKYKGADIQFKENIDAILKFQKENNSDINRLLESCKLALTILPDGIDIVKYFEVMNNRGKQLEKHQILKAILLNKIKEGNDEKKINYAKIWDYCSNMNVYIEDSIYYGDLNKNEKDIEQNAREPLKKFLLNNKDIPKYFSNYEDSEESTINKILSDMNLNDTKSFKEEFYVRQEYGTIIKFPIFIMQVFKIFITNNIDEPKLKDINELKVNERYLLEFFYTNKEFIFDAEKSKEFILFMLKMRIFYDYFIFKRDDNDTPIINTTKNISVEQNQNLVKNVLMLQLLFNFTAPQRISQDWVAVALNWLNNNYTENNVYIEFSNFLDKLDKNMALERLSETKDLTGLVNKYLLKVEINLNSTTLNKDSFENKAQINSGTSTAHYWFYKLDYLLWKDNSIWKDLLNKFSEVKEFKYSSIKTNFRLSRLNSIEHIYPQSKKEDWKSNNVDNFGNLALISNHMNSALNAQEDYNKRHDIQKQLHNGTIESLKMILTYSKYSEWNSNNCQEHQTEMINLLIEDLKK